MNTRLTSFAAALIALLLIVAPQSNAFVYQGVLSQNGTNAQGDFEMQFQLRRAGTVINVGAPVTSIVSVTNGLFSVDLSFPLALFNGTAYDLQINVRNSGSADPFIPLSPAQPLAPAPQALFANSVGSVPDSALSGNVPRLNLPANFLAPVSAPLLRIFDPVGGGGFLRFGPTDDCSLGIDPSNTNAGLLLRDPRGIRILPPPPAQGSPPSSARIIFGGPGDDCSIGIDPTGVNTGLVVYENIGLRITNPAPGGVARLLFGPGPTGNCSIIVDPNPGAIQGMQILEENGLRIRNPLPGGASRLSFGNNPDNLCVVSVEPAVADGLLLRDPRGIRILPPALPPGLPPAAARLLFGPTDDCSLGIDPTGANAGLIIEENFGVRITNPAPGGASRLIIGTGFGNNPDNLCMIAVDPAGPSGIQLRDPAGVRLLSPPGSAPRLTFGPTDDCSIGIDPTGVNTGLVVYENIGLRITNPAPGGVARLLFGPGPTGNCSIIVDPNPGAIQGMQILEENGLRIRNPLPGGASRLSFGNNPDNLCVVSVEPAVADGLLLRDPRGIRILPPALPPGLPPAAARLLFGPTDDCSLGIDPTGANAGLIIEENFGVRITNPAPGGASRLIIGTGFGNNPDNLCMIAVDPAGPSGIQLRDPAGVRLLSPPDSAPRLIFGPTDDCSIGISNDPVGGTRLTLDDVNGFLFTNDVEVQGRVHATQFVQTSTRRLKDNIKPIENALELIQQLQGVRYDWKPEMGGKPDIGFIAEEVGKVLPEVVSWEKDGVNAQGLDYARVVAIAVEGIKAQQTEIETLRKEKADIETRLSRLEALLLSTQTEK